MGLAILILFAVPFLSRAELRSLKFRYLSRVFYWVFVMDVVLLGYLGGQVAEEPYITISQIGSVYYFLYFGLSSTCRIGLSGVRLLRLTCRAGVRVRPCRAYPYLRYEKGFQKSGGVKEPKLGLSSVSQPPS